MESRELRLISAPPSISLRRVRGRLDHNLRVSRLSYHRTSQRQWFIVLPVTPAERAARLTHPGLGPGPFIPTSPNAGGQIHHENPDLHPWSGGHGQCQRLCLSERNFGQGQSLCRGPLFPRLRGRFIRPSDGIIHDF
jgi:hypothetical protein